MTDFFERVVAQDARVARATRMLPSEGTLRPEQRREAFAKIAEFLEEQGLKQADLAKAIREPQSVVSGLFTNSSRVTAEKRDEVLRKATAWVELETRAIEGRRQLPLTYQETKVARRLFGVCRKLTERPDMAIAWGPAGIGKSTIAKAIAAELPNVLVIAVRPDSRRVTGFVRAVHAALRNRRRRGGTVYFADVVEALKQSERVSARPLLIVDQCHLLHESVFQVLMDLHDEAGVSVLMLGTIDLHRRVARDDDPVFFGQLSSRIGIRCDCTPEFVGAGRARPRALFTVADVRAIFQSGKVKLHSDAAKLLTDIANDSDGHLRRVERLVAWATAVARKRCKADAVTILGADIRQASRIVEGEDRARTLPAEVGKGREAAAG
jgi:DNA transposition AAA+ family ATPase